MWHSLWRRWLQWLAQSLRGKAHGRAKLRPMLTRRPRLEMLEDRVVPDSGGASGILAAGNVVYNGGPLLAKVSIHMIFLKDSATGNTLAPATQAQFDAYFNKIVTDGYIPTLLTQYNVPALPAPPTTYALTNGTVGADDINVLVTKDTVAFDPVAGFNRPSISDGNIQNIVENQITLGKTAPSGVNNLYFVYTPPGDPVGDNTAAGNSMSGYLGYHSAINNVASPTGYDAYAVIPDETATAFNNNLILVGLNGFQGMTSVSSHEMVESITDPDTVGGWFDLGVISDGGEISDHAAAQTYVQDGYSVQYQWSNILKGPEHAPLTGANDLFINQITPPAVNNVGSVPVATFTTANLALTAASFTPAMIQVYNYDNSTGIQSANWVTSVSGAAGHFVINATPAAGYNAVGSYGSAFNQDGLNVIVSTSPINLVVGAPANVPISARYIPYVVKASAPMTYNADSGSGVNNFVLKEVGANFQLTDNGLIVFTQPIAQTTSIKINADPTIPGDPTADIDDSLTIDYSGGAFNNPITFDGGPGAAVHTLTLPTAVIPSETFSYTNANSGTITFSTVQIITFTNVTSIVNPTTSANITFNLPASAVASLQDDAVAGNGISEIAPVNASFPLTTFSNPATSLTVGCVGTSSVQLKTMDSGFHPLTETFSSSAGADSFQFINANAVASTTSVILNLGFLDLNGLAPTIDALNGNGTVTNSSATGATLTVGASGGSGVFAGKIQSGTGAVGLTKSGAGTETLSGTSTYTGATLVSAGILQAGAASGFSNQSNFTVNATLDLHGFSPTIGALSGNASGIVTTSVAGAVILTVGNTNVSGNFAGVIQNGSGTVGLTKIGSATLTLSGPSTYSGLTTVTTGTLQAGTANAFSSASDVTDNATVDLNGFSQTIGALSGSGNVTSSVAGAVTLTVGNNGHAGAFSGNIKNGSGTLTLVKAGGGIQTLSGSNTYSGTTTISAGTLRLGSTTAVPSTSDVNDAGILDLHGFSSTIGALSGAGSVTSSVAGAATLTVGSTGNSGTFSGIIQNGSGAVALTKIGAGTETLSGANTYNGITTITTGALQVGVANAIPSTSDVADNATLDLHGFSDAIGALTGNGIVTSSTAGAITLTVGSNNNSGTFTGNIQNGSATVSLTKAGNGTEILSGNNTYTGATTINAGTLKLGSTTSVPGGTTLTDNGILELNGFSLQVVSITGAGTVTNSSGTAATFTINNALADAFAGNLTGNLALTKSGAGTLTLSGPASTYSGATTISAGMIADGVANALPIDTALSVAGTLDLNGFSQQVASVTGAGTVTNSSGAAATFTVNNANPDNFGGALAGNLALTKTGLGTLTLSGSAGTYSGATTISAGTVADGIANALPTGTALSVTGTLDLAGFSQQVASVTGGGTVTNSSGTAATFTVNNAGPDIYAGTLAGNLAFIKTGSGGLTLAGPAASYSGATTISAGTLTSGIANNLPTGTALSVAGTLDLAGFSQQVASLTGAGTVTNSSGTAATFTVNNGGADLFAGSMSGNLALTNSGGGTLTLSGASNYSGATLVSAGALIVNGSITSNATVAAGANLGGTGPTGTVTVQNTGVLYPSSSVNTLTTGSLSLQAGSSLNVAIAGSNSYSQDRVTSGTINLATSGASVTLNLNSLLGFHPQLHDQYVIVSNNIPGAPVISGTFVAGAGIDLFVAGLPLPEGAILSANFLGSGLSAILTYKAGANNDSAAVLVGFVTPMNFTGSAATNNFRLVEDNLGNLVLYDNGLQVQSQLAASTSVVNIGAAGNDATLIIDYSGGKFTNPVTFDGGTGAGVHTLTLQSAGFSSETFTYTGAQAGNVDLDGQPVTFSRVTGIADTTTETDLALKLPGAAHGILQDDGNLTNGYSQVASTNAGFDTTTFANPSGSLTVTAKGSSTLVQLAGMDNGFGPTVETLVGQASDTFQFQATPAIPSTTSLTLTTASLDLNGLNPTINALNGAGTITAGIAAASTLTVGAGGGSGSFSGIVQNGSGVVALTKSGGGTETLSGANTYGGATTISAGTLKLGAVNAVPSSSDVTDNAKFDLNGFSVSISSLAGSGTVTSSASGTPTLTVGATGAGAEFSGSLQNGSATSLALTKNGAGTEILSGASNTFSGSTNVNAGKLQIGNGTTSGSLGAGGVVITSPGALVFDSAANSSATAVNFSNAISGNGAIAVISANAGNLGAVSVSGNNSAFTGPLKISGGSYQLGTANALGSPSSINVSGTGQFFFGSVTSLNVSAAVNLSTLGYADAAGTLGAIRFAGPGDVLSGPVAITGAARVSAYLSSGTISGNITGGTLEVGSGAGTETIILTGGNSYGATTINVSATLQIGSGGTAGTLGAGAVTDNGQLVFKHSDTVTVTTAIGGNGGLAQTGSGMLIVGSGAVFSYAGATAVSSGVLQVDGAISGSTVNVSGTGALTGAGTVGKVTASSGAITPGDGGTPGILATGPLTLQSGAVFNVPIGGTANTSQANVVTGAVQLGGATLNLSSFGGFVPSLGDNYLLINNNGGSPISGTFVAGAGITNFAPGASIPEGADISDNFLNSGMPGILTYRGGVNQQSVEISIRNPLNYTSQQATPNNFLLKESANILYLYDNDFTVPVASQAVGLTLIVNIHVIAGADASLTIDYTGGQFFTPVTFDGGTGSAAHPLTVQNGTFTTDAVTFTGARSGSVNLDGQTIGFTNVTALADTVVHANLAVTLPSAVQASLQDDGNSGNGKSALSSTSAFPVTTFANPATSLTVNTSGGSSAVQLLTMDAGFNPTSETFGGQAGDTFKLGVVGALPSASTIGIVTAKLDLNGLSPTIAGLTGSGSVTDGLATASNLTVGFQNGSASFGGTIKNGTGVVALTKIGGGVQTLAGSSSYTGPTTISAGTLQVGATNALSAASAVADNATIDLHGFSTSSGALSGSGLVTNTAATSGVLSVGADGQSALFSGVFQDGAGAVGLTKVGAGIETLTGANTHSGPTTISAGTLTLGTANALSSNSDVTDNAVLDLHGYSPTGGALIGNSAGSVIDSAAATTLTVGANGHSGSFAGLIKTGGGTIALTKTGGGTETLAGLNTYTGLTTITTGTLQLGLANAIPAASDVVDNATLDLNRFADSIGSLTGSGGVTNTSAAGTATLSVGGNNHGGTFSGSIHNGLGAVGLIKLGTGAETLTGNANSYSGATTISAGVLQAGGANTLSPNSDITDNATLDLAGNSIAIGALAGTGTVTSTSAGAVTFTVGANGHTATFSGAIKNGNGTLSFTKAGGGVQTLTGLANTFTGATSLVGGTLTVNDTLYGGTFGTVNLNSAGVTLNGTGIVRGTVFVNAPGAVIDGITITIAPGGTGITVATAALLTNIGTHKGITINGGDSASTGVLVKGSAAIFNSSISGHHIDVNVDGGAVVLQKDLLNAGAGLFATGLQVQNGGIADAGQLSTDATPLPGGPAGNDGFYGDITGLFSGTPLGSSGHSTGGNTFNGYTASSSATNPTVPQAIRDLNTGTAPFGAAANGVETSFKYGNGLQLGRMDITARNNTFNGVVNPASATVQTYVFDEHRQSTLGFVLYGMPQLAISQSAPPALVAPGGSFIVTVHFANVGKQATFGVIREYLSSDEVFNAAANPGWVNQGKGVITFNVGLLSAGASGTIQFRVTLSPLPPTAVVYVTAGISDDGTIDANLGLSTVTTKTAPLGARGRLS